MEFSKEIALIFKKYGEWKRCLFKKKVEKVFELRIQKYADSSV